MYIWKNRFEFPTAIPPFRLESFCFDIRRFDIRRMDIGRFFRSECSHIETSFQYRMFFETMFWPSFRTNILYRNDVKSCLNALISKRRMSRRGLFAKRASSPLNSTLRSVEFSVRARPRHYFRVVCGAKPAQSSHCARERLYIFMNFPRKFARQCDVWFCTIIV